MESTPESAASVAFGRFRVLLRRRQLIADGQPIKLGGRSFDVLLALVESRGAVLSKETLMERVWPGRVIEENALQSQIMTLRKAFGADRDLIRTVSGRGYQFTGDIRTLPASADEPAGLGMAQGQPASVLPPTNLPEPVSDLVGRTNELDEILVLVGGHRLVTLTGAGGIGKTRLALAAARQLLPQFADGAWFADFSPLADPSLVPATIAAAVGLELPTSELSAQAVARALTHRRSLLLLDTCEHVIAAAAAFAEAVLRAAAGVRIIVTSREPLKAEGEWTFPVPPLAVPGEESVHPLQFDAVRLFIERARAAEPHFAPDRHIESLIAAICRRLDGIPLAIEFAAARGASLGVAELAARLDDRFRLLTGGRRTALPRHQTLRATLDWSYELLSEPERVILRRLAVFAGHFSLEAASAIVAGADLPPVDVIDGLSSLVAKSLVAIEADGASARYRLLDTTRAYALERLEASDEQARQAERHADYYCDLFEREAEWDARPVAERSADCKSEIDNLRAALAWAFSPVGDAAIGVALAAASAPTWIEVALLSECRDWMARALRVLPPERLGTRQEMALQLALGYSAMLTYGLSDDARAALVRANELGKALDDLDYQLRATVGLVIFSRMSADFSPALALSRQVDAIAEKISTPLALATADCLLASSLLWLGEYAEARTRAERGSLQNTPEVRRLHLLHYGYDHWMNSRTLLAQILWVQGFAKRSLQLTRDVVIEAEQASHPFTLPYVLTNAGCLVPLWIGDLQMAEQSVSQLKTHAGAHGLRNYYAAALGFEGQLCLARGDTAAGEQLLRRSLAQLRETRFYMFYTAFLAKLAELLASASEADEALAAADEALARAKENKYEWCLPEALRIKGEVLLRASRGDDAAAEDYFRQSLELAQRQGALAWELRSVSSLVRLQRRQGRASQAHRILASVYGRFAEGFDTIDLVAATRLLDELSNTGRN